MSLGFLCTLLGSEEELGWAKTWNNLEANLVHDFRTYLSSGRNEICILTFCKIYAKILFHNYARKAVFLCLLYNNLLRLLYNKQNSVTMFSSLNDS